MDENDVKKFLGQKIKLYRKKTKMTQLMLQTTKNLHSYADF